MVESWPAREIYTMSYESLNDYEKNIFNLIEKHYPGWTDHAEFNPSDGFVVKIKSPNNPDNILHIAGEKNEVLVKFAVQGSNEHYDCETASEAFMKAKQDYIDPVLKNKMVVANLRYDSGPQRKFASLAWLHKMAQDGEFKLVDYDSWS